ncbi:MAG: carboxymuconolactone decarboxylase family protein [Ktedonobacteraceae bacterium]|nr:carboxymuconolactone decarboxylase family protein [Ktedonobacteraceae bacterium]MBO0793983.1 carboxymuconolactone decarboxylase family protein [Ktedonobacteraceae bacterium]
MPRIPFDNNLPLPLDGSIATMETLFRAMAQRPQLTEHTMRLVTAAMREGTIEPQLKELLAVRVSQVNHCYY